MARNLVLCLDGTSNQYAATNTNVVKLYAMLDRAHDSSLSYRGLPRQPSRYLSGALHADRGHEPVPRGPCLRARLSLQAGPDRPLHRRLPDVHLRPADGFASTQRIEVPAVTAADLILPPAAEGSAEVAACVAAARHPA
jgi:hypothetical protein